MPEIELKSTFRYNFLCPANFRRTVILPSEFLPAFLPKEPKKNFFRNKPLSKNFLFTKQTCLKEGVTGEYFNKDTEKIVF